MHEQIGEHILWHLPVIGAVHADTIMTTWLVMAVSLVLLGWIGASYRSPYVTKRQVVLEAVFNYIADLVTSVLGEAGEPFVPFFVALFIFIFLLNQFGMLPFKAFALPFGGSPTADLNTVVPLALVVFCMIQVVAFRKKGLGYFGHVLKPFAALLPINILDEILRPITLAARLFFNIFVGELLFVIITSIIVARISIGFFNLSVGVAVVPILIQFFNFFVGTIQAFVFTLLAIVYLSLALADEH
ncbi:MAG: F0F1 ATP synthase subunit A [Candidatus Eremiobacteraeota bacterium]|nr:F0F1 ATP synthase subunit A [Candidatus Eremiobacteraeota bacterium]